MDYFEIAENITRDYARKLEQQSAIMTTLIKLFKTNESDDMPSTVNFALCSIPDLVELAQLQERIIKEQEEMIAMLKEALYGCEKPTH